MHYPGTSKNPTLSSFLPFCKRPIKRIETLDHEFFCRPGNAKVSTSLLEIGRPGFDPGWPPFPSISSTHDKLMRRSRHSSRIYIPPLLRGTAVFPVRSLCFKEPWILDISNSSSIEGFVRTCFVRSCSAPERARQFSQETAMRLPLLKLTPELHPVLIASVIESRDRNISGRHAVLCQLGACLFLTLQLRSLPHRQSDPLWTHSACLQAWWASLVLF